MTDQAPRNTIIQGDCTQVLPRLPAGSVNFALTDPPYLVRYAGRDGRRVPNDDNDTWLRPAFRELHRVLEPDSFAVSFYGWAQTDRFITAYRAAGFRIVGHFVCPKRYSSSARFVSCRHECAHLIMKGEPPKPAHPIGDVLDWRYTGNKLHPTQKTLSVLKPLVTAFSRVGGLVLDPFAGSGSSLLAAKNLGRDWLGIELDPGYHAIASDRLAGGVA